MNGLIIKSSQGANKRRKGILMLKRFTRKSSTCPSRVAFLLQFSAILTTLFGLIPLFLAAYRQPYLDFYSIPISARTTSAIVST